MLAERLREHSHGDGDVTPCAVCEDAALRIEELERKRQVAREALGGIAFDIRHGRLNEALAAVRPTLIAIDDEALT